MEKPQETMEGLIQEASDTIWNWNGGLNHNQIDDVIRTVLALAIEVHDREIAEKVCEYPHDLCDNSQDFKNYVLALLTKQ